MARKNKKKISRVRDKISAGVELAHTLCGLWHVTATGRRKIGKTDYQARGVMVGRAEKRPV